VGLQSANDVHEAPAARTPLSSLGDAGQPSFTLSVLTDCDPLLEGPAAASVTAPPPPLEPPLLDAASSPPEHAKTATLTKTKEAKKYFFIGRKPYISRCSSSPDPMTRRGFVAAERSLF